MEDTDEKLFPEKWRRIMDYNAKKKVVINIAGAPFTFVTDETDVFVAAVERNVNEKIRELTRNNFRVNRTDAAIFCAVDLCSDKLKAEKRVMNLEAQVVLYNESNRRLREENIALKQKAGIPLDEGDLAFVKALEEERQASDKKRESPIDMEQLGDMLRASGDEGAEDKLRTLEKYLKARKQGEKEGQTREDKLRQIEKLLRGDGE